MMYGWTPAEIDALSLPEIAVFAGDAGDGGGGLSHAETCRRVAEHRRLKRLGIAT